MERGRAVSEGQINACGKAEGRFRWFCGLILLQHLLAQLARPSLTALPRSTGPPRAPCGHFCSGVPAYSHFASVKIVHFSLVRATTPRALYSNWIWVGKVHSLRFGAISRTGSMGSTAFSLPFEVFHDDILVWASEEAT